MVGQMHLILIQAIGLLRPIVAHNKPSRQWNEEEEREERGVEVGEEQRTMEVRVYQDPLLNQRETHSLNIRTT